MEHIKLVIKGQFPPAYRDTPRPMWADRELGNEPELIIFSKIREIVAVSCEPH